MRGGSEEYIRRHITERYSDSGRYFRGSYRQKGIAALQAFRSGFDWKSHISYDFYLPRPRQRYLLLADHFKSYLSGTILDVGSRDAAIRDILGPQCTLIDKDGTDAIPFDWEKAPLPFPDNSFDTVVCLDTLEHIENIHEGFHDLVRVSQKYVVISLPNVWRKTLKQFLMGYSTLASYGLPLEKPDDRHKWFFSTEDIENFMFYNAAVASPPARVADIVYHIPKTIFRHRILYFLGRVLLPDRYFRNFFVHTVFVCIEKA